MVQIWSADGSKIYLSHTRSRARLPERATLGFADVVTAGERWRVYSTLASGRVIQVGQPFEVREQTFAQLRAEPGLHVVVLADRCALPAAAISERQPGLSDCLDRIAVDPRITARASGEPR